MAAPEPSLLHPDASEVEVFYEERWLTEPQYESAQSQLLLDSQKAEFEWLEKEKLAAQQAERRKEEERAKEREQRRESELRIVLCCTVLY